MYVFTDRIIQGIC